MFETDTMLPRECILILILLLVSCSGQSQNGKTANEPDGKYGQSISSEGGSPLQEVRFIREISIGDSPEQPIGQMGGFAVDETGQIYINDVQTNRVHIIKPDGEFVTTIGRSGRGPGEFTMGPLPVVRSNQLFLIDVMSSRVSIYTIGDLEPVRTIRLNPVNQNQFEELSDTYINQIQIINEERFLVRMFTFIRGLPDQAGLLKDDNLIYYFLMEDDARLTEQLMEPVPHFELTGRAPDDFQPMGPYLRAAPSPQIFPQPIVTVSENGNIYTAMSDQIRIRKYSQEGEHQRTFTHHFNHVNMSREDAVNSQGPELVADLVSQNDVPETWPALEKMLADDADRIWIATIVEDFSVYEWWVLDDDGELITKFEWPRNEPIEVIKDDYIYTRQTDEETGLQQVVRYRVEIDQV